MNSFNLRPITFEDWRVLLEWRNHPQIRENSHNSNIIKEENHKSYIKNLLNNKIKKQFIFEVNNSLVGTIREDILDKNTYELSYIISPKFQGKKLGNLIMGMYLYEKKGTFICEIKPNNIPSIKMVEKNGFTFFKEKNNINYYKLVK